MTKVEHSDPSSTGSAQSEPREKTTSMIRGARKKCPSCGEGSVFSSFLKVIDNCPTCGEELHHQRSDDAAPYFTIFIIGHIIVPLIVLMETYIVPPVWVYGVTLLPLIVVLTLLILPRVKGAIVGLQWALKMHGFDQNERTTSTPQMHQDIVGQE